MWEKIALTTLTILLKMVAILPFRVLYIFSDMVYPLIYYVVGYRRKVVRTNLTKSFPELDLKEIVKIEKKFYRHFCDYVFETIKLLHISDKQMQSRLRFTNIEEIEKRRGDGRPFFIYLAHQGNWEYVTSIALWCKPGLQGCQIYHPLSNKTMDKFFLRLRSRFNTVSIPQKQTLRVILNMINEGKQPLLGLISDQRPDTKKLSNHWMTFLNQQTPIIVGGETLGVRLNAHFIYGQMTQPKRGYYEITLKPIEPIEGEECSYSKQYMRQLEKDIQAQPHLWLWTHKRWLFKFADLHPNETFPIG